MKRILSTILAIVMSICLISCLMAVSMPADNEVGASDLKIGDYFTLGKYNDEPILWRYAAGDENGKLILSDKILCVKFFDTEPEWELQGEGPGKVSRPRNRWGSNYWKNSNIRSWLNSNEAAGEVQWLCGQPPRVDEGFTYRNSSSYADEKGFLADGNFTDVERTVIKEVQQKSLLDPLDADIATSGNKDAWREFEKIFSGGDWDKTVNPNDNHYNEICSEEVADKVFLLDLNQIYAIYQNREIIGDYCSATYTDKTWSDIIARLGDSYYDDYIFYSYWLRTPYGASRQVGGQTGGSYSGCDVLNVETRYTVESKEISRFIRRTYADGSRASAMGVRPAFYLNTDNMIILSGSGSEDNPYVINGKTEDNSAPKTGISVFCNNFELKFDVPPIIENDRTLVPFRAIFEALGADVFWDETTQTVTGELNKKTIRLSIDDVTAYVNEQPVPLDVPPKIVNGRTLVPLRFIAENFGLKVDWDEDEQRIEIGQ